LIKNFQKSLGGESKIIARDHNNTAPALYLADSRYVVPKVIDPEYIPIILEICIREKVRAVTTFIDPEIEILAQNRGLFEEIGVEVLAPDLDTARLCFDKLQMYQYSIRNAIPVVPTYGDYMSFFEAYKAGRCTLPVFVKPRTGSGSVGARPVECLDELKAVCAEDASLIIQHFMDGDDLDADVYVDTISHRAASIFTKRKLETKLEGANKTISFKDTKLFELIVSVK